MKKYAMTACLFMAALNVCAQTKEKDSLRVIDLQEVEIISTRATGTTPVAFTNINKEKQYTIFIRLNKVNLYFIFNSSLFIIRTRILLWPSLALIVIYLGN